MPGFYDNMADTSQRVLAQFGRSATLQRDTETSFDPMTGRRSVATENHPVICVVLPASKGTIEAFDNRIEGSALARYRFVVIAAKGLPVEPRSGDRLLVDGDSWRLIGATPVSPAGTAIIYRAGVTR